MTGTRRPAGGGHAAIIAVLCAIALAATAILPTSAAAEAVDVGRVSKGTAVRAVVKLAAQTKKARLPRRSARTLAASVRRAVAATRRDRSCAAARALTTYVRGTRRLGGARRARAIALARAARDAQLLVLRVPRKPAGCGGRPQARLAAGLRPATSKLPPRADGAERPVARLAVAGGAPSDFAEDEVVVSGRGGPRLDAFLRRWNGKVIATTQLPGAPEGAMRLVRIDPRRIDTAGLSDDLLRIDPRSRGTISVSTRDGLGAVAAAADGAARGLTAGLNVLGERSGLLDGTTTDTAPLASDGKQFESALSSSWRMLRAGPPLDIDVPEAWRVLAAARRLQNKIAIGVADGGFAPSPDYPNPARTTGENRQKCGNNSCPWHGTNVSHAAAAVPDNRIGAAGPAGPVAHMIHAEYDGGINAVFEAAEVAFRLASQGARIINMSWTIALPATVSFALKPFEVVTRALARGGRLVFAAAGNEGKDVDAEDCFVSCWEEHWIAPCENDGVICVGGVNIDTGGRHSRSNFGEESCGAPPCSVTMWGPFTVYVGPDPAQPFTHPVSGTSIASPFAAGVAALVWAADPRRSAGEVLGILRDATKPSGDRHVRTYVHARDAVRRAVGATVPLLEINSPANGTRVQYGPGSFLSLTATAADAVDKACCDISWSSSLDGPLGRGREPVQVAFDKPGVRTITASIDTVGGRKSASITVEALNALPTPVIQAPAHGTTLYRGATYDLRGHAEDINETGGRLDCGRLAWRVVRLTGAGAPATEATIAGCNATHAFSSTGTYRLELEATDGAGAKATATRAFDVTEPPANAPPIGRIVSPENRAHLRYDQYYSLRGEAYEPDGDAVTYRWSVTWPGGSAVIGEGQSLAWRPRDSNFGICGGYGTEGRLVLTVQDDDGSHQDVIEFTTDKQIC